MFASGAFYFPEIFVPLLHLHRVTQPSDTEVLWTESVNFKSTDNAELRLEYGYNLFRR